MFVFLWLAPGWVGRPEPGCWRESLKECALGCAVGMEKHAFQTTEVRLRALSVRPLPFQSLPLRGRPARTPHRRSQAGADVSAGLCGQQCQTAHGDEAPPWEPGFAFLPCRCCEHPTEAAGPSEVGGGSSPKLASRKVTVQIGYCFGWSPWISSSPKQI